MNTIEKDQEPASSAQIAIQPPCTHDPGHYYRLKNFENPETTQPLQFIEKRLTGEGEAVVAGQLVTVFDGTTNEEVLRVLIDRMGHLQAKFPCRENAIVLTHLETALLWLEKRTADRKARGVEGKHAK